MISGAALSLIVCNYALSPVLGHDVVFRPFVILDFSANRKIQSKGVLSKSRVEVVIDDLGLGDSS